MSHFLYRWFGMGRIPKRERARCESEGIVISDEGLSGVVIFENIKAPGRRHRYKKTWMIGSIVLTNQRLAAFAFSKRVINVPRDDPRFTELTITAPKENNLRIAFEPGLFNEGWSGRMEIRYTTAKARRIQELSKAD